VTDNPLTTATHISTCTSGLPRAALPPHSRLLQPTCAVPLLTCTILRGGRAVGRRGAQPTPTNYTAPYAFHQAKNGLEDAGLQDGGLRTAASLRYRATLSTPHCTLSTDCRPNTGAGVNNINNLAHVRVAVVADCRRSDRQTRRHFEHQGGDLIVGNADSTLLLTHNRTLAGRSSRGNVDLPPAPGASGNGIALRALSAHILSLERIIRTLHMITAARGAPNLSPSATDSSLYLARIYRNYAYSITCSATYFPLFFSLIIFDIQRRNVKTRGQHVVENNQGDAISATANLLISILCCHAVLASSQHSSPG